MVAVTRKDLFSPTSLKQEIYSDFLANFDIHPVKKDVVRASNEDAVKGSIRNLLLTNSGDRMFNNTLGSNLRSMLFEPMSVASDRVIEDLIRTTIDNYEPRAKVEDVRVASDEASHTVIATIVFSVINKQEPITLELLLNRIR